MTDADQGGALGFFDSEGKWVTAAEFEEEMGDEIDTPVRELWEELEEIDMLRVRRNDAGEPVTAQLSQFAVDLFELPEDARVDEEIAVFVEHGKEPPEEMREEYFQRLSDRMDDDDFSPDALLDGGPHV